MQKRIDRPGPIAWDLWRSFLAVLQHGSLSAAARALDLTQPTLGRHVAALEAALGLTLFVRAPTGLLPTEAALALRGEALAMQAHAAALARTASGQGDGVRGTVRISASEVVAVEVLPALLAPLRSDHPALVVELVATDRVEDLLRRDADVAIRMAEPRQQPLVARRVGTIALGLFAHPDYLARHGTPQRIADLPGHALIGHDDETPFVRGARDAFPLWQRGAFAWRTDSNVAQLALIRAGCGIGICQVALAERSPRLVRVLPAVSLGLPTWVVMHEDLRTSARCTVVFDALAEGLRGYAA